MNKEEFIQQKVQQILGHESVRAADRAIMLQAARWSGNGYQGELLEVPLRKALEEAIEYGKHG